MSKKDDLKAFHVDYIHKDGGKRKRLVLCKDIKELNNVVLKLQAKGGVIVKVEDITFN